MCVERIATAQSSTDDAGRHGGRGFPLWEPRRDPPVGWAASREQSQAMEIVVRSISPVVRREMRPDEYVLPFMLPQMCTRMGRRRTTQHTRIATFRIARSHACSGAQIPVWAVLLGGHVRGCGVLLRVSGAGPIASWLCGVGWVPLLETKIPRVVKAICVAIGNTVFVAMKSGERGTWDCGAANGASETGSPSRCSHQAFQSIVGQGSERNRR